MVIGCGNRFNHSHIATAWVKIRVHGGGTIRSRAFVRRQPVEQRLARSLFICAKVRRKVYISSEVGSARHDTSCERVRELWGILF